MTKTKEQKPLALYADILNQYDQKGLKHAFFTRHAALSKDSAKKDVVPNLNVNLPNNREIITRHFGIGTKRLVIPSQIHSNLVVIIDEKNYQNFFQADALVTKTNNIALGILTADCGPVLFYDYKNQIIGAAHAGWRGAFADIIENTITTMEVLGAERPFIKAALGPTIGPEVYVIDERFKNNFLEQNLQYERFFIKINENNHFLFHLWRFILFKCQLACIEATALELCTYKNENLFFSYRRTHEKKKEDGGRQISAIMLSHKK